jgi:hypothetical protein
MTRSVNEFRPSAEGKEQQRAREHVKRVFGREPVIRSPKLGGLCGVYFARLDFGSGNPMPLEFIVADGFLIGIPPGKPTSL